MNYFCNRISLAKANALEFCGIGASFTINTLKEFHHRSDLEQVVHPFKFSIIILKIPAVYLSIGL